MQKVIGLGSIKQEVQSVKRYKINKIDLIPLRVKNIRKNDKSILYGLHGRAESKIDNILYDSILYHILGSL